jgi:hypothetical protein
MGQVTHEQVNLMLHLYELRREARLREARAWFAVNFTPGTLEDVMKICPPGSEANTSYRMVTSYWEMVANIVNRGLIDEEFFFENSGEQWLVWDRLRPIAEPARSMFKNPHIWKSLEAHCTRLEAWREKRAPGATEAMREMMKRMMANAGSAQGAAKSA